MEEERELADEEEPPANNNGIIIIWGNIATFVNSRMSNLSRSILSMPSTMPVGQVPKKKIFVNINQI